MKIGAPMFFVDLAQIARHARLAEELGYESIWLGGHIALPQNLELLYPGGRPIFNSDTPMNDPLMVFAYLSGLTSKIKFGTGVYLLPMRHPVIVARLVATLDQLCRGRFMFGVGIGWFKGEFDYVGMNFTDRARRLNEYLRALTALFSQDVPEFEGATIRFKGLKFNPKPVQLPHPPFLIGGLTDAGLRRAARYGDGFYGSAKSPEDALDQLQRVRRFETEYHRTVSLEISFSAHWAPLTLDQVRRLGDAGVDRLCPGELTVTDSYGALQSVYDRVISRMEQQQR